MRRIRFTTVSNALYLVDLEKMQVLRLPGDDVSRKYESRRPRPIDEIEQLVVGEPARIRTTLQTPSGPYSLRSTEVVSIEEDPDDWEWDRVVNFTVPAEKDYTAIGAIRDRLIRIAQEAAAAMAPPKHPAVARVQLGGDTLHITFEFWLPYSADTDLPRQLCEEHFESRARDVQAWLRRRVDVDQMAVHYTFPG